MTEMQKSDKNLSDVRFSQKKSYVVFGNENPTGSYFADRMYSWQIILKPNFFFHCCNSTISCNAKNLGVIFGRGYYEDWRLGR